MSVSCVTKRVFLIKREKPTASPLRFIYCKPVSRILFPSFDKQRTDDYHLSGCHITATILLPTLPDILRLQKYKRAAYFASRQIGIYVALQHTRFTQNYCYQQFPWALTSRFHPYPPKVDGNFLWHFLPDQDRDRPLTGVLLFAVRTFLSDSSMNSEPER